jgi:hypothetical protein
MPRVYTSSTPVNALTTIVEPWWQLRTEETAETATIAESVGLELFYLPAVGSVRL